MAGFRSIAQWSNSVDTGKRHVTTFRKAVSSVATAANDMIDYTYYAGNPPANFYASAPLIGALIEGDKGLHIPRMSGTEKQFYHRLTVMSAAASATSTTNQNQRLLLADYLKYYPFVDTDAVGEGQTLDNTVVTPRYGCGQVMVVSQSAASTNGTFTINYTNQSGVPGRVSQPLSTKIVSGGGILLGTHNQPFVELQAGDLEVSSIESVNFSVAGGGLMSLVIVKPLVHFYSTQECRRTTATTFDSFGAASQFEAILHTPTVEFKDGAVLGIIGMGYAGSLASSVLVGTLETTWR